MALAELTIPPRLQRTWVVDEFWHVGYSYVFWDYMIIAYFALGGGAMIGFPSN